MSIVLEIVGDETRESGSLKNEVSIVLEIVTDETEEWRSLSCLGFSKYEVSSLGRVRTIRTGYTREGPLFNGFKRIGIKDDNDQSKNVLVHVLVASAFLGVRAEGMVVGHRDRNGLNNRLDNLEWTTQSKIAERRETYTHAGRPVIQMDLDGNFVKRWDKIADAAEHLKLTRANLSSACGTTRTFGGYRWRYDNDVLDGEEWRLSVHPEYKPFEVSSLGRLRRTDGKISNGSKTRFGYVSATVYDHNGEAHTKRLHELICAAFFGRQNHLEVNHKDGDKTNNKITNLEYVTPTQNVIHSIETGLRVYLPDRNGREVQQIDANGEIIATYRSIASASQATGVSKGNICTVCTGGRPKAGGFGWRHLE